VSQCAGGLQDRIWSGNVGDDLIEIGVSTPSREVLVDITRQVQRAVVESEPAMTGMVSVFVPHTTAGVTINENADPAVIRDMVEGLARLVPRDAGYRHGEGNSDAHIKASLMGSHVLVPVENGRLRLGTWQSVYLAEFDGPRSRRVWVIPIFANAPRPTSASAPSPTPRPRTDET
jgi:secondary thiamine-phosphate synthase enzyme